MVFTSGICITCFRIKINKKMKRISEYFAPTAATKKPKTQVEPPPNTDNSPQPSNELKTAPETSTNSDKKRGFQRIWLTNERFKSWLSYDEKENQMKCTLCLSTGKLNPFVSGCSNFRTSTLDRHMASADHVNSLTDKKEQSRMKAAVNSLYDKKKNSVICAMRTVYWLCKEQIATVKYSSLLDLLKLQGCPDIESLYSGDNATYQSGRAAEDFQDAICQVIETDLKQKIASSNVVSLMCDESDDISVQKKLVVYVRLIPKDSSFEPETYFLDNVTIEKGDAETIYTHLKATASDKGIDVKKIMFLGSDGASVMTGRKSGVSARLSGDQPFLVNIHCMAHKLALCTSHAADSVNYLKKHREILTNIFYYFKHSSLRTANLSKIVDVLDDKKLKIKEIHAVRWFAFYSALEAVFHTWGSLVTYFEQEKQSESGGAAKGIHSQLTQFEFVAVTYLLMDIMPILTKLSLSFQKKNIDIAVVQPLIQSTISQLEYLTENDGPYMTMLNSAVTENHLEIKNHIISMTKNKATHFKSIRAEFIQQVISQLHRRFPEHDTSVIRALAILGMKGITFVEKDKLLTHGKEEIQILCEKYGQQGSQCVPYVDEAKVKMEWEILKHLVIQQKYPTDNIYTLWKIIHTHHQDLVPNMLKLAELALIVPLQTADCERGFSTQNDIKTSDRNRLSADRLNTLMRIAMNKASVADFDYERAVGVWRGAKDRRAFRSK